MVDFVPLIWVYKNPDFTAVSLQFQLSGPTSDHIKFTCFEQSRKAVLSLDGFLLEPRLFPIRSGSLTLN